MRESFAKSSLVRVRHVEHSTFFTKGKLNDLGLFIKENQLDVVYLNTILSPLQQNRLEKRWNDFVLDRTERLRRYYVRSVNKREGEPTDIDSSSGYVTGEDGAASGSANT